MKNIDSNLKREIILVNKYMDEILYSENAGMKQIIEYVLQSRGKQIRSKLLLLSSKFGKSNADAAKMAAMLEIIHLASLIHDDVIDDADMRRGNFSVQKKYGKNIAVYAGDFMIFCLVDYIVKDDNYKKYFGVYNIVKTMCYGELGQNENLYDLSVSPQKYIENIFGKTAVMFQTACKLGAASAKANSKIVAALGRFGENLGLLFQIQDDLLDYMSDEQNVGKPIFQDFAHGIYTLPILYTVENAACREKVVALSDRIKNGEDSRTISASLLKIVRTSGGMQKTYNKASEFYDIALKSLEVLPEQSEKTFLKEILSNLMLNIKNLTLKE